MSDETNEQRSGLSRRDALKRGAAVGGALWVAPLVTAAPAFGAEGSPPPTFPPCTTPLWVKFEDPDQPELDFETETHVGTGSWDDNPNTNFDTCLGTNWDDIAKREWVPTGATHGTFVSFTGGVYKEEWRASYMGKNFLFVASITQTMTTICVTTGPNLDQPVQIQKAQYKQGNDCQILPVSGGNCLVLEADPDGYSHITFVICG